MIKLLICGACGKMGRILSETALHSQEFEVCVGVDKNAAKGLYFPVYSSFENCPKTDCAIDFSNPEAVFSLIDYALKYHVPLVLATTGYTPDGKEQIIKASKQIPIFMSSNLSRGVSAVKKAALSLREDLRDEYDVEIIETHHRNKLDSPSGTALMLANAIAGSSPPLNVVSQRKSGYPRRSKNDLCISSVRGGGVFGDHTIMFMSDDEVVELTHRALNRRIFAKGALEAAEFIRMQSPGIYTDF